MEVEIILAAHRLYTEQGCLGGIDSLVNLTALSVVRWANHQEFRPLATLAAGERIVDPYESGTLSKASESGGCSFHLTTRKISLNAPLGTFLRSLGLRRASPLQGHSQWVAKGELQVFGGVVVMPGFSA